MWEESPMGTWTLEVVNDGASVVRLVEWSLSLIGTETHPQPDLQPPPPSAPVKVTEATTSKAEPTTSKTASTAAAAATPVSTSKAAGSSPAAAAPNQPTADVGRLHQAAAAAAALMLPLDHCLKASEEEGGACEKCEVDYVLHDNGRCVEACPADGYFQGVANYQNTCIKCYYSCKSCSGPNDYDVRQTIR